MVNLEEVTLVIPSYNNLKYLKKCYRVFRKHYPKTPLVLIDDGSTDGTGEWLQSLDDNQLQVVVEKERLGHTIRYDQGFELARTPVVGILHADMFVGPGYLEELLKVLEKGRVVCGRRVEPPLHPEGNEKIIQNFGIDIEDLNLEGFDNFCKQYQKEHKGEVIKSMFAPWIIYKEDLEKVEGHDPLFAPFPFEDSDIFQRWLLTGLELRQAVCALVYHLTCRGHRWTEEIGKDDDFFLQAQSRAQKNYLRKWGVFIKNDLFLHPVVPKVFDLGVVVEKVADISFALEIEPFIRTLYLPPQYVEECVKINQKDTIVDLSKKILPYTSQPPHDIIITLPRLDGRTTPLVKGLPNLLNVQNFKYSVYMYDTMKIEINTLFDYSMLLIRPSNHYLYMNMKENKELIYQDLYRIVTQGKAWPSFFTPSMKKQTILKIKEYFDSTKDYRRSKTLEQLTEQF